MKVVSDGYKNNIKKFGREISCIINYSQDGELITLNDNEIISAIYTYNGNILTSVMKEFEFEVRREISANTMVNLKLGLKVGKDYEYINYGNFFIKDIKKNKDIGSFTYNAYDNLIKSMVQYDGVKKQFPCTIKEYLIAICNECGIKYELPSTFINSDISLKYDYFLQDKNIYTYRDIIDKIAEATGSIISIKDNKLNLMYPTETMESITPDNLSDINVEIDKLYGPVNNIVVEDTLDEDIEIKDNESINNNGLFKLEISDNRLFNKEYKREMLNNLYNSLKDLSYTIVDIQTPGITYLELGDIFTTYTSMPLYPSNDLYPNINLYPNGELAKCLMLSDTITIKNGLEETFYTETPYQSINKYDSANDRTKTKRVASVVVDKALNEVVITADHIDLSGKDIDLTSDNITISSENFSVDEKGKMICKDATIDGGSLALKDHSTDIEDLPQVEFDNYQFPNWRTTISSKQMSMENDDGRSEYTGYGFSSTGINDNYGFYSHLNLMGVYVSNNNGIETKYSSLDSDTLITGTIRTRKDVFINGGLQVNGAKNRVVKIDDGSIVALNAYETATPYFGDIGSDITDENGECTIDIENIFSQTIEKDDYKVFIQECGNGKVYVEKHNTFFIVKGTPNLEFDWEIKAIQKGYKNTRLEKIDKESER